MAIGADKTRILVVEKDGVARQLLLNYLKKEQIYVTAAARREEMSREIACAKLDLVLLDLNQDKGEGLDFLRQIRSSSDVPIIVTTETQTKEFHCVAGLELGADDCLVKPFSLRELLARILAVLRRRQTRQPAQPRKVSFAQYTFRGWQLNCRTRRLINPDGALVALTNGEYALLVAFLMAPGRVLTREYLVGATKVHGDVFDRCIDVQVLRLRRKLKTDQKADLFIQTERSIGYRFTVPVETARGL